MQVIGKAGNAVRKVKPLPVYTFKDAYSFNKHVAALLKKPNQKAETIDVIRKAPARLVNTPVWNTVIKALGDEAKIRLAWDTFNEMKKRGCKADAYSYAHLLSGCSTAAGKFSSQPSTRKETEWHAIAQRARTVWRLLIKDALGSQDDSTKGASIQEKLPHYSNSQLTFDQDFAAIAPRTILQEKTKQAAPQQEQSQNKPVEINHHHISALASVLRKLGDMTTLAYIAKHYYGWLPARAETTQPGGWGVPSTTKVLEPEELRVEKWPKAEKRTQRASAFIPLCDSFDEIETILKDMNAIHEADAITILTKCRAFKDARLRQSGLCLFGEMYSLKFPSCQSNNGLRRFTCPPGADDRTKPSAKLVAAAIKMANSEEMGFLFAQCLPSFDVIARHKAMERLSSLENHGAVLELHKRLRDKGMGIHDQRLVQVALLRVEQDSRLWSSDQSKIFSKAVSTGGDEVTHIPFAEVRAGILDNPQVDDFGQLDILLQLGCSLKSLNVDEDKLWARTLTKYIDAGSSKLNVAKARTTTDFQVLGLCGNPATLDDWRKKLFG